MTETERRLEEALGIIRAIFDPDADDIALFAAIDKLISGEKRRAIKMEKAMHFRIGTHIVSGKPVVEVRDRSDRLLATIYPNDHLNGINIVSKFIRADSFAVDRNGPPAVLITFAAD